MTAIGDYALQGCPSLKQVDIPLSVTKIGEYAFRNCSGLLELRIPPSVVLIGTCAFLRCAGLTRLEIASSVTTIGEWAFSGCSNLAVIQIPSTFSRLGYGGVFDRVTKLAHLILIGCPLSPTVVASLEGCLTPAARVIGPCLVGQKFGRFTIVAT
jgi:hypothetical protein